MSKTLTAALILTVVASLAACGGDLATYPTSYRVAAPGVELPGATIDEVCTTIADAACAGDACRFHLYAHCAPYAARGRIEAPTLEAWDDLWAECLARAAELQAIDLQPGNQPLAGCERLTPLWR